MSGRGSYLLRKVGWAMVTVFVVITFNFVLFRVLPGDPAKSGLRDPRLSPAAVQALRERFGVDKPLFLDLDGEDPFDTQYVAYLRALSAGDLGTSYAFRDQQVSNLLGQALVNTLWLVIPSQFFSIVIGTGLGLFAAWKRGRPLDVASLTFSLFMWSLPTFFLGIILLVAGSELVRAAHVRTDHHQRRLRLVLGPGARRREPPAAADPDPDPGAARASTC